MFIPTKQQGSWDSYTSAPLSYWLRAALGVCVEFEVCFVSGQNSLLEREGDGKGERRGKRGEGEVMTMKQTKKCRY